VHFFALDTEESLDLDLEQGRWLAAELAGAAAQPGFRFSVVFLHRPLVTCGDSNQHAATRDALQPLFIDHGVELVVQGHVHGYERFELGDVTYLTTGGGGGALGNVDANLDRPECAMRAAAGNFFHAVVLDVAQGRLSGRAIDDAGVVRDTFEKSVP
jgi:3',5'-cyclic AMP phosphodiesterase CpdA